MLTRSGRLPRLASPLRIFAGGGVAVPRAIAEFALSGLVALAVLGFLGVKVLENVGTTEAIRNAKKITALAGDGIVAPRLTRALLSGDTAARRSLDAVVRRRVLVDGFVRVKVWDARGTIVYSDEPRLVGRRYPLGEEEAVALRRVGVHAELSDLNRPENVFERRYRKLLEVYLAVRARDGTPLLFESYQPYSSITASAQRLWKTLAPALIGALAVLWLAQIPLAWSLARRLRRGQDEREALLRHAIEASDRERARIARDLHDGVVQDLVGLSYSLAAVGADIERTDRGRIHVAVDDAAERARESIRSLRTLLVDIYPPNLHSEGLPAALADLLAPLSARGVDVTLDAPADLRLPHEAEAVLFRAAQESLRNVIRHSDATAVTVRLATDDGHATLEVRDDGRGFAADSSPDGHFGLRMLRDLTHEVGGELAVEAAPGAGTGVRVEVPVR